MSGDRSVQARVGSSDPFHRSEPFRKQEISFLGDTVNTTARIKDMCRELNRPVLLSGPLLSKLRLPDGIEPETLGPVRLRGREQAIDLFGLRRGCA